jgi:zinc/manganese transport system permease protein
MAVWYFRDLATERVLFYGVFAVVITASVQVVGVLLVFASLIIPALATQQAPTRWRLAIAFNIGAAGYLAGLVASAILDISSGAAIVCTLAIIAAVAAKLVSRKPKSAEARERSLVKALQDEIQTRLTKTRVA